ncbi:hypothetical protein F4803DRAFT_509691 [Xylaria telfairii]|nr:hypothetical protein F4803DRAFT_509691 [Xylaria telfairii]
MQTLRYYCATEVTVIYPPQPNTTTDSCEFAIHRIEFDCEELQSTKEYPTPITNTFDHVVIQLTCV